MDLQKMQKRRHTEPAPNSSPRLSDSEFSRNHHCRCPLFYREVSAHTKPTTIRDERCPKGVIALHRWTFVCPTLSRGTQQLGHYLDTVRSTTSSIDPSECPLDRCECSVDRSDECNYARAKRRVMIISTTRSPRRPRFRQSLVAL